MQDEARDLQSALRSLAAAFGPAPSTPSTPSSIPTLLRADSQQEGGKASAPASAPASPGRAMPPPQQQQPASPAVPAPPSTAADEEDDGEQPPQPPLPPPPPPPPPQPLQRQRSEKGGSGGGGGGVGGEALPELEAELSVLRRELGALEVRYGWGWVYIQHIIYVYR